MKRKEENPLNEALASVKYLIRHRGPVKIPFIDKQLDKVKLGKKVLYLDNQIPAQLQDTFDNLGYEQKDGQKPVLADKRKTPYGWHLIWNLPPGVSFKDVKNHKGYFQDAVNGWIELEWKHGKCHMNVQLGELPEYIEYQWAAGNYQHMLLPIPIGYSRTSPTVLDLPESPHFLIAGATGFGKTSMIMSIIHSLLGIAIVIVIDLKGIDFAYLEHHCLVAQSNEEAYQVLGALNAEYERRKPILRRHGVRKWSDCPEEIPYIVVVIDEMAELNDKCFELFDRLVRLARATGISIIAASQRTSTRVISGDTRANFVARMCFKVGTDADSRVVLGEDCSLAGQLPAVKGRAIYRYGIDTIEVQSMYLSPKKAEELLKLSEPQRGWEINVEPQRSKPEAPRLAPR